MFVMVFSSSSISIHFLFVHSAHFIKCLKIHKLKHLAVVFPETFIQVKDRRKTAFRTMLPVLFPKWFQSLGLAVDIQAIATVAAYDTGPVWIAVRNSIPGHDFFIDKMVSFLIKDDSSYGEMIVPLISCFVRE